MGKLTVWLMTLLAAAPAAFGASGATVTTPNVRAHLESEVRSVAPGRAFTVALVLDIRDGWHTYWRNPGDSGRPTRLAWTLPAGFTAGPIEWPAPHRFVLAPLVNFGYAKQAVHLVEITAPPGLAVGGPVRLRAQADWLVCSNLCIPEHADLDLALPTSTRPGAADPGAAALFATARAQLPRAAPAPATAAVRGGRLVITLGPAWGATLARVRSAQFLPYDDGVIDYEAPQVLTRSGGSAELAIKAGDRPPQGGRIRGVLLARMDGADAGPVAIAVAPQVTAFAPQVTAAASVGAVAGSRRDAAADAPALWTLIGFAVLGGLVLNLMPCVLPVLSIKAVSLAEQAKKHPREARLKGLAFAAGVIASMLALSAVLLALRAGGEQIGWGFQLQSPLFVTLMTYLLFAVGLNLSGVFEVGGGLAGLGEDLTRGDSRRAAFFTGVLTTLVATPCTAPFMAAAVGAALAEPPAVALAIFAALGLGLSLPLLVLSFAPWFRRALPKPGAWMETLKQALAFPMYASAAWLVWVLAQQTTSAGLAAALGGLVLIALAAWAYRRMGRGTRHRRLAAATIAIAALAAAIALPVALEGARAQAVPAAAGADAERWEPYDPARVTELRAAGKPVLIDFTASWCLTCLVNERTAFSDPAVRSTLRDKGVTLFKGDWTNGDPRITRALAAFGRAGVPLYVVYNATPGSDRPLLLPQLLTAGAIERAFQALPGVRSHRARSGAMLSP